MDTSETYIKMSEKAEEIQELRKEEGAGDDVYICSACKTRWGNCYEHTEYLSCNSELGGRPFPVVAVKNVEHKPIWLPRQDQLQGMVKDEYAINLLYAFHDWYNTKKDYPSPDWSMEQFWLAFVMGKKYNKVWANNEWRNGSES